MYTFTSTVPQIFIRIQREVQETLSYWEMFLKILALTFKKKKKKSLGIFFIIVLVKEGRKEERKN